MEEIVNCSERAGLTDCRQYLQEQCPAKAGSLWAFAIPDTLTQQS